MINISQLTTDISTIAKALLGKWERKTTRYEDKDVTWVILGQVVFLEGDVEKFPYDVMTDGNGNKLWHGEGSGHWAILK